MGLIDLSFWSPEEHWVGDMEYCLTPLYRELKPLRVEHVRLEEH